MNKIYFYLFYIPVGLFLLFSIGPHLKNRKYKKDMIVWNAWVNERLLGNSSMHTCFFCKSSENFEQEFFRLPKSVKKTLFSFSEAGNFYSFISVRCKRCQTEIGRKMT